jgi:hypothetical protein
VWDPEDKLYTSFPWFAEIHNSRLEVEYPKILEQCTGLKDRHGKLIFEGDVVKTVTGAIGIVQWIPARCGFLIYFPDNAICLVHETQEIIGNIHDEQFREVTKKVENERD